MKDFNEVVENMKKFLAGQKDVNESLTSANLQDMNDQELIDFLDSTWNADSLNRIARS